MRKLCNGQTENTVILIAAGSEADRFSLREILCDEYSVTETDNGQDALDILSSDYRNISALILSSDIQKIDGFEPLEIISCDPHLYNIPVLCFSADGTSFDKSFASDMSDFIVKPFEPEIICQRLKNMIELSRSHALIESFRRDRLTGLLSREAFLENAEKELFESPEQEYMLVSVDIDNFKVINDKYGIGKGDEVLSALAVSLISFIHDTGDLCGRISADNFIVLSKYDANTDPTHEWSKLPPINVTGVDIRITVSIGIYIIKDRKLSVNAMYDRANLARANIKGRYDTHIAVFSEDMREKLLREQETVNEMYSALGTGQFEPWFQPQFNHSSGALVGAEALVRWRHPIRGIIPPCEFIPIFEHNGFIYELDKYIWERVCFRMRKWADAGKKLLPVSVNVSRYDLFQPDLCDIILNLTEKYSVARDMLRLEVTESSFSQSSEQIISVVKELISHGFTVEIDDFGSGYSSLNTLKDVPAQVIKLDMRFISDGEYISGNNTRSGTVLESVVRMAKWLGMSVIAEGVEKLSQADFLTSIGCCFIQGYLYARPMPYTEYEELLSKTCSGEFSSSLKSGAELDSNAFWSPDSLDTLIFNSYVGPACIFELHGNKIEVIRVNQKFAEMQNMSTEQALSTDWNLYLTPESRDALIKAVNRSVKNKSEEKCELVFNNLTDSLPLSYFNATLRVITAFDNRIIVYSTGENTTVQNLAKQAVKDSEEQLGFLNELSSELLAHSDVDSGINSVLHKILVYFLARRACLIEYNAQKRIFKCTYEVCADGVQNNSGNLQNIPEEIYKELKSSVGNDGFIDIPDIMSLPDKCKHSRLLLRSMKVQSLFAVPFYRENKFTGMILTDTPTLRLNHKKQLLALGDYIAVMLTRRDLKSKIIADNAETQAILADIPGGFVRLQYVGGNFSTVYVNDAFCRLRGMSSVEILKNDSANARNAIHPDDIPGVIALASRMMNTGEKGSIIYRLKHSNGGYVLLRAYANVTKNDSGEIYFNIFHTEATPQEKSDFKLREAIPFILSAIMDSSPDLSFAKDRNFNYICCSPGFVRFARQKSKEDIIGKSDYDIWTKEEADRFRADDERLFSSGKSLIDYIEPIPSDDGIRHYSVTSKFLIRDSAGEIVGMYGSGRDITDTHTAFEQLRLLTDNLPGGIVSYCITKDGIKETYFNDGFCKMLGSAREEYRTMDKHNLTGLVFREDLPGLQEQIKSLYENGTPINYTYRNYKLDGSGYVWIRLRAELTARDGDAVYANAVLLDITGQMDAEKQSRETAGQMQAIMRNIGGGVAAVTSISGKLYNIFYNDGFCKLFGYTRDEFSSLNPDMLNTLVYPGDIDTVRSSLLRAAKTEKPAEIECRVTVRNGDIKWVRITASVCDMEGYTSAVYVVVLYDITRQKETIEMLRAREAEYLLAIKDSNRFIYRYNHADNSVDLTEMTAPLFGSNSRLYDVPESMIKLSNVMPESIEEYRNFYRAIKRGDKAGTMTVKRTVNGKTRWYTGGFSNVFDNSGKPISAIIVFYDSTEQQIKESIYLKWQQSMKERDQTSYTLFRVNISKNLEICTKDGSLLNITASTGISINNIAENYALSCVYPDDREAYLSFLSEDTLLTAYHRGIYVNKLEYRDLMKSGGYRWLCITAELVQSPNSSDIEAYLMYEDIDTEKRRQLRIKYNAEHDPLTGVLNRAEFARQADILSKKATDGNNFVLMMLDVDNFKQINDTYGHEEGDRALVELSDSLKGMLRAEDILGRLGGDEFLIGLKGMKNDTDTSRKARQFCDTLLKHYDIGIDLTVSIGIAVCPRDGTDFTGIYGKSDAALYKIKNSGKNSYAFYSVQS